MGGILSMEDLSGYHAQFCEPVTTTFQGCEVWGQDSWTQGPMLMQALNILENFDLKAMGHNSPAYIHTVAEALKLCFGDREAFYGDPDFATVPMDGLLSKEYAAIRAGEIDPEGAYPEQRPAGDPWRFSTKSGRTAPQVMAAAIGPDTSADDGTTARVGAGPARQPGVRHHQRRLVLQIGVLPRTGRLPEHAHRDVQLRAGSPERGGAGQAAADDAGELHRRQGREARHDLRVPRRRQPSAG